MKASEAAKLADINAKKLAKKDKEEADRKHAAEVAKEKAARNKFRNDLREQFYDAIRYGVQQGRRSGIVYIGGTSSTPVDAENAFDNHGYIDIIKQVMKEVVDDGYKVTTRVQDYEYRTSHESSVPDYTYYEYRKVVEVNW